ncbi:MAG TPA: hypothetical protein VGL05_03210 [Kribbella sp.]
MTPQPPYFQLGSARLYQPDAELSARLPAGTAELAAYIKTLVWVCTEFFDHYARPTPAFGNLGLLIAAGFKPGGRVRVWCDVVDGSLPVEVQATLEDLLNGAGSNVRPQVTAPVAVALEGKLGAGPAIPFPEVPTLWQSTAARAERRLRIPDDLFLEVFPD